MSISSARGIFTSHSADSRVVDKSLVQINIYVRRTGRKRNMIYFSIELMVVVLNLAVCFHPVSIVTAAKSVVYEQSIGTIVHPDVSVYDQLRSQAISAVLPLGCFIIFDENRNYSKYSARSTPDRGQEMIQWLYIRFPSQGWVAATSVQKSTSSTFLSLPLWESLPQLYSAGHGVMASRVLSFGWVHQWPIGTGGIGIMVTYIYFNDQTLLLWLQILHDSITAA